jgi:PAS domain-containing protein
MSRTPTFQEACALSRPKKSGRAPYRCAAATASTAASPSAAAAWSLPGERPFVLNHGIDVTEQHEAEEALHMATRQRELILESVGDGIYGIDLYGRITFINQAGARALGYTPES